VLTRVGMKEVQMMELLVAVLGVASRESRQVGARTCTRYQPLLSKAVSSSPWPLPEAPGGCAECTAETVGNRHPMAGPKK
jgi:hypothetical protein